MCDACLGTSGLGPLSLSVGNLSWINLAVIQGSGLVDCGFLGVKGPKVLRLICDVLPRHLQCPAVCEGLPWFIVAVLGSCSLVCFRLCGRPVCRLCVGWTKRPDVPFPLVGLLGAVPCGAASL